MRRVIFLFFLLACGSVLAQAEAITFQTDFETTADWDGTSDAWVITSGNNGNPEQVTGGRTGTYALRLQGTVPNRNELVKRRPWTIQWGFEYWIGISIKVVDWVGPGSIIMQIRDYPDNSQNPFSLTAPNANTIYLEASHDSQYAHANTPATGAGSGAIETPIANTLGEWRDFVFNFKLDPDNGYFKMWVDGDLVYEHTGTTVYELDNTGAVKDGECYWKIGPYYCCSSQMGDVYYDSIKIYEGSGGVYEDVSPGGLSPNGTGGGGNENTTSFGKTNKNTLRLAIRSQG